MTDGITACSCLEHNLHSALKLSLRMWPFHQSVCLKALACLLRTHGCLLRERFGSGVVEWLPRKVWWSENAVQKARGAVAAKQSLRKNWRRGSKRFWMLLSGGSYLVREVCLNFIDSWSVGSLTVLCCWNEVLWRFKRRTSCTMVGSALEAGNHWPFCHVVQWDCGWTFASAEWRSHASSSTHEWVLDETPNVFLLACTFSSCWTFKVLC